MNQFGGLLQKLESQLQSKRKQTVQESLAKERDLLDETAKLSSKSKKFTKILSNVEGVLKQKETKSA